MNMLNAGSHAHDPEIHDLSGNVYTNHGPLTPGWHAKPGDHLLLFHDGYFYIGEVVEVDGGKARFLGERRWWDTLGMTLLTKQGVR